MNIFNNAYDLTGAGVFDFVNTDTYTNTTLLQFQDLGYGTGSFTTTITYAATYTITASETDLHLECATTDLNTGIAGLVAFDIDGIERPETNVTLGAHELAATTLTAFDFDEVEMCESPIVLSTNVLGIAYLWSNGSTTYSTTATEAGIYYLEITDYCGNVTEDLILVTHPVPTADFFHTTNYFTASFTNTSIDGIEFEWNFGDGNTSNQFEPTHVYDAEGIYEVLLTVYGECDIDTYSTTVEISENIVAPIFTSLPIETATSGAVYTYDVTVEDADGDISQLEIIGYYVPTWLSFTDNGNGSATLTGTPTNDNAGINTIVLRAIDDGNNSTLQTFDINVSVNLTAPVFTSTPVVAVISEDVYTYDITVEDADGDISQLEIIGDYVPSWLTFTDNGNGSATLTGTPTNANGGTNTVVLRAFDEDNNSTPQAFDIEVSVIQAINENNISFNIYPNPTTGIFNIETEGTFELTITDISGKVISEIQNFKTSEVDLSSQANGIYFIKFQNSKTVKTVKIIKQ